MADKATKLEIAFRRKQVSNELAKHNYKAEDIAQAIKHDVKLVYKDMAHLRKQSNKWLDGWALDGYTECTKVTIDQLERMERNLQKIINESGDERIVLRAYQELRETINLRWVVQGEGPTLMNLRRFKNASDSSHTS